ncbi:MAG: hypothetical protein ACQEQF_10160 [Bacillota bacterium]
MSKNMSSNKATKEEIREFLIEFKNCFDICEDHNLQYRKSTNHFFETEFCIFKYEINEKLENLTVENYLKGPEDDHSDYPGEIWVFKFNYDSNRIYFKMRKYKTNFVCFKIHIDDGSKECPYKESSTE